MGDFKYTCPPQKKSVVVSTDHEPLEEHDQLCSNSSGSAHGEHVGPMTGG